MSRLVTLGGIQYTIPDVSENNWGQNVTDYLVAIPTNVLTRDGGSFALVNELDFGVNYGIKLLKLTSQTVDPAVTGVVNLSKTDIIAWRNNGNTADLTLNVNGSDKLQFEGVEIVDLSSTQILTNKTLSGNDNTITDINATSVGDGSVSNDYFNFLPSILTTGSVKGGVLSVNGVDTAQFDISAGEGWHVNTSADPANPVVTKVTWVAQTAITITNIGTQPATTIAIDSSGTLVQLGLGMLGADSPILRRQYIMLGVLEHVNGTSITGISNKTFHIYDTGATLHDVALSIGPLNLSGNLFSSNGANLKINKSEGEVFALGLNSKSDTDKPNHGTEIALTETPFIYSYRDGSGGFTLGLATSNNIDPGNYDDGSGTLSTVTSSKFTIQRGYLVGSGTVVFEYGQTIYNSLSEAQAVVQNEIHEQNPVLSFSLHRVWLVVKGNAADLSDISQAEFFHVGKFGSGAGGGSSSTTTLQQAYNNSSDPEITLDPSSGGITIRDNSTPIGSSLFNVTDNASTSNYFDVTVNGISTGKEFRLWNPTQTFYVGFKAPTALANQIWTLPLVDGSAGQFLQTDGTGNLIYATPAGAGDVTAASNFGTDNVLIRSDGTGKGVQSSGITINNSDHITAPSGSVEGRLDAEEFVGKVKQLDINADNVIITISDCVICNVTGNGASRSGTILSTIGAEDGQIVHLVGVSWGVSFTDSTTADFGSLSTVGNSGGSYNCITVAYIANSSRWVEIGRSNVN